MFGGWQMLSNMLLFTALLVPVSNAQTQDAAAATAQFRAGVAPVWENFAARYQTHICPFHGDVKFDEKIIECGSVLVPEDRTNPDSRLIRLAVMQVKSSSGNPPGGTVVRLEGGPGGSGLSGQRAEFYSGPAAAKLREVANYVFFDQRGIGHSEPAFCRAVPQNYQYGEAMGGKGNALYFAAMRRCYDEARAQGIQINAYSNWQNALDVRDLRRALGHRQWTLYGISYGTQLGQGVMRVDPEGTRAAILDSVVPQGEFSSPTAMAENFRTSLDVLADACRAQPSCARAYPDLRGRFYDAIRAYGKKPLVIKGLSQSISMTGRAVADDTAVANLVFQLLYRSAIYQDVAILLDALEKRDVAALRAYVEAGAPPLDHRYGNGMGHAIGCRSGRRESASATGEDTELAESAEWFKPIDNKSLCDLIDPAVPDGTSGLVTSEIPTLVLAGEADPVTPASYSRSILDGLSRATYVEFPFTGHGAAFSNGDCGREILTAFIADPDAKPDVACAKETKAPTFLTSWRATPKAYPFLTSVQEGARPIFPIAVVVGLVFALFAYPIAAIGRRLERRLGVERTALRMLRLSSWGGALLSLGGLALAAKLIMDWSADHVLAVPLGLPDSIAYAGLLALAGLLVAGYAVIRSWAGRKEGTMPVGTLVGTMVVALCALGALAFLFSIGSGPFLV